MSKYQEIESALAELQPEAVDGRYGMMINSLWNIANHSQDLSELRHIVNGLLDTVEAFKKAGTP